MNEADAPWAIELRPFGAEKRLRRRNTAGTKRTCIVITSDGGQAVPQTNYRMVNKSVYKT